MATAVDATDDAARVLGQAGAFLTSDPIAHNLILTLLHDRVEHEEPGRYWVIAVDDVVAGVVFQSPLSFTATITPMPAEAAIAAVDAIVYQGVTLPGINGDAATAARFAGHWAQRTKMPVRPVEGQRLYELDTVQPPRPTTGKLRVAAQADRDLLVRWLSAFEAEVAGRAGNAAAIVDRRLAAGHFWMWDDGGPVAMTGVSRAVAGAVRVGPVYTPPDRRGRGYASAVVASVSQAACDQGQRCLLYTELVNPTSNAIYQAIGYRAVSELVRYQFG